MDDTVYVQSHDVANGDRRWESNVGRFGGSPTVADGVLYVGTWEKELYALDGSDGSKRWSDDAEDAISGSVAVADGVFGFGDDYGNIVALAEP
ncbi:PQQ-binding-like beta-propeller repeat protein [Natrinema halophilum]|uniref:outer membrane protein assembly factor BamB family protein n=1 Tax=Natrinema halophilum TaxID=1699371 RepID=UPI0031BBA88D